MRIDSHAHGSVEEMDAGLKQYLTDCCKRGVEGIVLISSPTSVFEAVEKCSDFVIPVVFVSMDEVKVSEIDAYFARGAKGIKFIQPDAPYHDERYLPLYQRVLEHDGVAVFHTGYLSGGYVDITHMRPACLDAIARRLPELRMLMAHFGNPWWDEAWKIAWAHPNIYADLSGGTAYRRSMMLWRELFAPDGNLHSASFEKLCFGSDTTYFRQENYGFQPYIDFYERLYEAVGAPDELRERVNIGNIKKLFRVL